MGVICEQNSREDKAIGYYQKILKLEKENSDAIEHIAMLYRRKQNWQEIIDVYQPLFKEDPDNLNIRVAMAEAYYYLKELDKAQQMLEPALKKVNAPWGVYDLMGRIELENRNYKQALGYFNTIIEIDSTNRFGWLFLGFTYSDMGDIHMAESIYARAVKILPEDASLWSYYGLTLYSQKKFKEAIEPLKKALAIEPLSMNVLTTLPIIYENLEMYTQSDSLYEVAIKLFPDNYLLLNNYGYSLSERGIRMAESLAMSQKAVEGQPDNAAFLDTMGWIYFKLGKYEEAKVYIEKSIEIEKISPVVLEHLGDVYLKLNNVEKALNYWIDSLNINPENKSLIEKVEKYK
jgi:tetratricopeptide (TPR) repeat protein